MRSPIATLLCTSLILLSSRALADNLSQNAKVEIDIFTYAANPPALLFDNNSETFMNLARVDDAEFRVRFERPATVQQVVVVQGYSNWSLPMEFEFESADGTVVRVALKSDSRDPQALQLNFPKPTAFIDVRVSKAKAANDGKGFGGIAEMRFEGSFTDSDTSGPTISAISVQKDSPTSATVRWTTSEVASSQVRFSSLDRVSQLSASDAALVTSHEVKIAAQEALGGQIEIRSTDSSGNRAEQHYDAFTTMDSAFQYGVAGTAFKINEKWVRAAGVYKQDDFRVNVLQTWLGGNTWDTWFNDSAEIKKVVDEGYIPEIIHLYFDGPGLQHVEEHHDEYIADIKKLAALIKASGVGDKTIVTLEPEYNQGVAASWDGWNDLMIEAIGILHLETGAKVGLLPGPWDIAHVVPISMGRAAAHADFVALQQMKGSVTNTPEDARSAISNAIQFTHFLNRRFLRPVRLGYLMISTYNNWEYVQRDVAIEACERLPELKAAGLSALSWMAYLDHPSDGALGAAESFKGLKTVNNEAKPAFYVWQECMKNGPSWIANGTEAPGAPSPTSESCACRSAGENRSATLSLCFLGLIVSAAGIRRYTREGRTAKLTPSRLSKRNTVIVATGGSSSARD